MKRYRRLRRLEPDPELVRRRAAGETLRELAGAYGVAHTTLSRYFARPKVVEQLKHAAQVERAERHAAAARWRAEQKAGREADRTARRQRAEEARRAAVEPPPAGSAAESELVLETVRHRDRSPASGRSRHASPLALVPFSDDWLGWYGERRLRSEIDMLNDNDARRGILPPSERRAREHEPAALVRERSAGHPERHVQLVTESGKTIASTSESNAERMTALLEPHYGPLTVSPG